MTRDTALTWSWLNVLTKQRYDAIIEVFGDLGSALKAVNEEFLKGLGCKDDTARNALVRLEEFDAKAYENELQKKEIKFLTIEDENYPTRLKEIADPPVFLYYKGSLEILDQPSIALVGTREMSAYGKRVAEAFAGAFVRAGLVTVSGLALGIDAEVAKETIASGGKTVAVLGHGLSIIYPQSNGKIAEKILTNGGLLLSEFPLDMQPGKFTFPARNRIIAGLTLGTVVLEAPRESGSIITAELALEYGREVFVVPGQIFDKNYGGSHDLISKAQAKLVSSAEEVLKEIGIVIPDGDAESVPFTAESEEEEKIFSILSSMPQKVDDIVERSGLDPSKAMSALTMMELAGAVKNVGSGLWVKK